MKTFDNSTTTTGVARRVWLSGCLMLTGLGLVLGLNQARTAAQPGTKSEKATGQRLNHIDLVVSNVKENREFFEKHFGFKTLIEFPDKLAVTTDGAGTSLVLSSPEIAGEIDQIQRDGSAEPKDKKSGDADAKKPIEYPKGFHIGFHQDSKEAVDEMYKKLKAAGVAVQEPKDYHGAWTFYVRAPGGYYVEVFHQSRRGGGR
jgi:catechol 2,3-dioxygenase-like lactoylglutathione lyase family enzyme